MQPVVRLALALLLPVLTLPAAEPAPSAPPPPAINPDGWPVHDPARPVPPRVQPRPAETPAAAVPPPGAVILFDGGDLSAWRTPAWIVQDGILEVAPKTGNLLTRQSFGSCHLHLEWSAPLPVKGSGQGRGNSGIFFMDRYEIQVLDNHENATYADGYVGAVYGQHPPLANAVRPPGEWNTYDIFFRAPLFSSEGKLLRTASVTVLLNGIVVQNNTEFYGISGWKKVSTYSAHPPAAPLRLQDHGDRVRFRNIWLVPTPELPAAK